MDFLYIITKDAALLDYNALLKSFVKLLYAYAQNCNKNN